MNIKKGTNHLSRKDLAMAEILQKSNVQAYYALA
jgi:hypothetical protein